MGSGCQGYRVWPRLKTLNTEAARDPAVLSRLGARNEQTGSGTPSCLDTTSTMATGPKLPLAATQAGGGSADTSSIKGLA